MAWWFKMYDSQSDTQIMTLLPTTGAILARELAPWDLFEELREDTHKAFSLPLVTNIYNSTDQLEAFRL